MLRRSFATLLFILVTSAAAVCVPAQSESREALLSQFETKRAELAVLEKKLLLPADGDCAAYAEFLTQPDTGLIRLMPREVYDSVASKKGLLAINGGGAFYSFARLTHEYGYGSDISFEQGYLSVGFAGADYGMVTKVGEIDLNEISVEHPSAFFLANYKTVTAEPAARLEWTKFGQGIAIDGLTYSHRVKAEVGMTYLVRSISYSRSDVLVAFKIARQDADGSLIIVWKLLKKYPKPELARNNQ